MTLPQHIDRSNADQMRERLLWVINRGAAVLIADLAGTASYDYSGADALARAHHRAVANETEFRLVAATDVVRRMLRLNGLDRLVPVYPDLEDALAGGAERPDADGGPDTAVTGDQVTRAVELLDSAARTIFAAGLMLQGATELPGDAAQRITEALGRLDDEIRGIHDRVFADHARVPDPVAPSDRCRRSWSVQRWPRIARRCCGSAWRNRHSPCISPRPIPPRC